MVESTFLLWKDLGSNPRYDNCVLFLIGYYFSNMLDHDEWL